MPAQMQWPTDLTVSIEPLSPEAFAPFGTVIQNPSRASFPVPPASIVANQGSATKYSDVSPLVSSYDLGAPGKVASPRLSMFSCKPRRLEHDAAGKQVFKVGIVERHPFTPQTFIPMGLSVGDRETAYLVIVAPTAPHGDIDLPSYTIPSRLVPSSVNASNSIAVTTATPKACGPPDIANIRAFVARGDQAVTYGAGTWHAPMVVLGKQTIDFVVVQYTNGVAADDCQEVVISGASVSVQIGDNVLSDRAAKL